MSKGLFSSDQITIIVATYKRPKILAQTLRHLSAQSVLPGQTLIADGADCARTIVEKHGATLSAQWLRCPERGQITQRNYALRQLNAHCQIVMFLDDDILLEREALAELIKFWNAHNDSTGRELLTGVSARLCGEHINNKLINKNHVFRRLFYMSLNPPGKILRSGYNTPLAGQTAALRAQWLYGGATSWRRETLEKMPHPCTSIRTDWAVCEDLIFSYEAGKHGALYLCETARAYEHINAPAIENFSAALRRGYSIVVWRHFFVSRHPELSKYCFAWMTCGQILGRLLLALRGQWWQLGYVLGHAHALARCMIATLIRRDPYHLLH